MIKKMKPKTFTAEQISAIKAETVSQKTSTVYAKSLDPANYPVFEIPVNSKVLVYVPNHTIINEETGLEELRMDKALLHEVKSPNSKFYDKVRCVKGLSEAAGYSSICPVCNGESEPWDLARQEIAEKCAKRGLDPKDKENPAVKELMRASLDERVIKKATPYYTFPIVVIETDPASIKTIIVDENTGKPKHKVYWYTITESFYSKTWGKALENHEDEPTHAGGRFFVLDYTYEDKTGNYNKRDSAKNLSVSIRSAERLSDLTVEFDKETEEWDQSKSISTVIMNQFYSEEDLKDLVDECLVPTRKKLAMYELGATQSQAVGTENLGFGAMIPESTKAGGTDNLPLVGETDAD